MDESHKDTQKRFAERRQKAITSQSPDIEGMENAEIIPIRPIRNAERLTEIAIIYSTTVKPVVDILTAHDYEREALILSANCSEALWNGANIDQVKIQIQSELAEIDPTLPSFVIDVLNEPDPKPE